VERLTQLEQEIERKRKEMYDYIDLYGLLSSMTLQKSQELDALLNQYQQKTIRKS
jgi:hypothetical protein